MRTTAIQSLSKEEADRREQLRKMESEMLSEVEDNLLKLVEKVAKDFKVTTVYDRRSVLVGGNDLTEEVIKRNRELFRHHKVEATAVDINTVIGEAMTLVGGRLRDNEIVVVTSLAGGLPAVSGDQIELQQVLLNLISNAIDAMETVAPESRRIDISSSCAGDQFVQVRVTDQGKGLEGVDVDRMFTLSYTTKDAGTGVGLSVSRSIVEAHGGKLWAEQNAGRGATFCFTVPVRSSVVAA
jgi:signal transduction histidine kinase